MYFTERYHEIIKILKERNGASVHFLAEQLHVSEPTIRRDLTVLEQQERIRRTFGGAVLNDMSTSEIPLSLRESENRQPKEIIAKKAIEHISDGKVIFIDASSTASNLIKYLPGFSNLTIITNSPKNSLKLAELRVRSFCTGGLLLENSIAYVGKQAEDFVRNFNADLFFFSSRGLSDDGVLSDSSIEESELRRVMMEHSRKKIFLCTSDKIGKSYMYNLCRLGDVNEVISEISLPEHLRLKLDK